MGGLLIFLIFLALVAGSIASRANERKRHRNTLEDVARRHKGVVACGAFWQPSSMFFEMDGLPARLTYQPGDQHVPPRLTIRFDWPMRGRLRVLPHGAGTKLRRLFGAHDIALGDPELDRMLAFQGGPDEWVRGLFGAPLRERLIRLIGTGSGIDHERYFNLEGGPTGLTVRVAADVLENSGRLHHLLSEVRRFLRALRECEVRRITGRDAAAPEATAAAIAPAVPQPTAAPSPASGITILPAGPARREDTSCPVCGEPLGELVRRCNRCRTEHHEDCWQYFGGCAIFACQAQKSRKERRRRRTGAGP